MRAIPSYRRRPIHEPSSCRSPQREARYESRVCLFLLREGGVVGFRAGQLLRVDDLLVDGLARGGEVGKLRLTALAFEDIDRRDGFRAALIRHRALGDGPVDATGLAALLGRRCVHKAVIHDGLRRVKLLLGLLAVTLAVAIAPERPLAGSAAPLVSAIALSWARVPRAVGTWAVTAWSMTPRTVGAWGVVARALAFLLRSALAPPRSGAPGFPRRPSVGLRGLLAGLSGDRRAFCVLARRCAGRSRCRGFSPVPPAPPPRRPAGR